MIALYEELGSLFSQINGFDMGLCPAPIFAVEFWKDASKDDNDAIDDVEEEATHFIFSDSCKVFEVSDSSY